MPQFKRLTLSQFKGAAKRGEPVDTALIEKGHATTIRQVGFGEDRLREFVVSTADVDRDGDSVSVDGWLLDNFNKAGSVLWAHDIGLPPIAEPIKTFVDGAALKSVARFAPIDMPHPFGEGFGHTVMRMYDEGLMRAVSVGFLPKEWKFNEERGGLAPTDFVAQELLEWSAVPVPSNPNALFQARGFGIDVDPIVNWAEDYRDNPHAWFGKTAVDELLDSAAGEKLISIPERIKFDPPSTTSTSEIEPVTVTTSTAEIVPECFVQVPSEVEKCEHAPVDPKETIEEIVPASRAKYASALAAASQAEDEVMVALLDLVSDVAKQGRVLSRANEDKLIEARDLLSQVIDSAKTEPAAVVEDIEPKEFIIEIEDEETGTFLEADPDEVRSHLRKMLDERIIYRLTGQLPQ